MNKFEGVANTLFIPLVARIYVSGKFPEYFCDAKALELKEALPEGAEKGSSEYTNMASVARYFNMDRMVREFAQRHETCNIVVFGAGLETMYDRLHADLPDAHFYECDLPEVIKARRTVLGEREDETLIGGDMFAMEWTKQIDASVPALLVVSGVFQYFHEAEVVSFIRKCAEYFNEAEMLFDATNESGLRFTNWFVKHTGNKDALMYFYVNDAQEFAGKAHAALMEVKLFFPEALQMLGRKLSVVTRISMKWADHFKQVQILHLKLR